MKKEKKFTDRELVQAHVFPHNLSKTEKERADKELWEIRKKRLQEMTSEKLLLAQLMSLKFRMSQYISSNIYDSQYSFSYFLKEYINSLNKNKRDFSEEISLHNTQLSRLLHDKEEPNKNILIRLDIHSNNSIPALYWLRVVEKQKELELMSDKKLWDSENKKVKKLKFVRL